MTGSWVFTNAGRTGQHYAVPCWREQPRCGSGRWDWVFPSAVGKEGQECENNQRRGPLTPNDLCGQGLFNEKESCLLRPSFREKRLQTSSLFRWNLRPLRLKLFVRSVERRRD